ncbi:uncharacterized protein HKW66_Vig0194990 [Vigna angularis]|uniref:Bifunctional inhibitor/plant lipid transfer protein/seed storage helical domain-containing protein n=1 Tax=Phaseolus angularis TaxID=3914 RepID=A0A8T0KUD5_PHAAN|nr:uncharacterized protein HKW66_Vig0194990 [Vigna angularis]
MASFGSLSRIAVVLAMALLMVASSYGQISTPCNASMAGSFFTPCMNFLTNSSGNGTSPTTECCSALKSLTSGGMECLCLIVTGSVPFRIPLNRTIAISLPRACNMPGVPLQCKGPVSLGPSPSPASASSGFSPTPSPQGSTVLPSPTSPSLAPQSDTPSSLLTPPSPSADSGNPSVSTGSGRTNVTPSSAMTSYNAPPYLLFIALGFAVLKYY